MGDSRDDTRLQKDRDILKKHTSKDHGHLSTIDCSEHSQEKQSYGCAAYTKSKPPILHSDFLLMDFGWWVWVIWARYG